MVIVSYSPTNFKFLTNSYLENLFILPSFIYGIQNELPNIKNSLVDIVESLYLNKPDLSKDIITNGNIFMKYIRTTSESIKNNINQKLKETVQFLSETAGYYETVRINTPNYLISDTIITSLINPYQYLVIINCNYVDKNNYDILNILFVIFNYKLDSQEKKIFETKTFEFTKIII